MIIVPVEKQIDWRRPPLVLIALVLINVLVFAFFQSGDNAVMAEAVEHYQRSKLLDTEWRAYQAYQRKAGLSYDLDKDDQHAPYYIIGDSGFDRFMAAHGERYIPSNKRESWRQARDEVERISNRSSTKLFAFYTDDISIVRLFTSQFLHADLDHLVGNMVFLILVGFAAEAALGSGVFLLYYLVSGAAGTLFYAAFASGNASLIGASGAVSGVMAMYVALFGMRKIQFFYWVFVFTGYLRAAAIIMLPMYLLKELYYFMTLEGSNVAFTAHIGGFLAGAGLVFATQRYRAEAIDEAYLDNKPAVVDRTAQAVERVYEQMGRCEFARAWELLKPIKQTHPEREDIIELEYNLVRALHPGKRKEYLLHRLDKRGNSAQVVAAQVELWRRLPPQEQARIEGGKRSELLKSALELQSLDIAEQVFNSLRETNVDNMGLAVAARQLSVFCRQNNKPDRADKYNDLAQNLAQTDVVAGT